MEAAMDANGLVVMSGKGPVWKMAPGRSSTLKLRNGETDESVMIFEEVAPVGARYGNAASQHHCWRDPRRCAADRATRQDRLRPRIFSCPRPDPRAAAAAKAASAG